MIWWNPDAPPVMAICMVTAYVTFCTIIECYYINNEIKFFYILPVLELLRSTVHTCCVTSRKGASIQEKWSKLRLIINTLPVFFHRNSVVTTQAMFALRMLLGTCLFFFRYCGTESDVSRSWWTCDSVHTWKPRRSSHSQTWHIGHTTSITVSSFNGQRV